MTTSIYTARQVTTLAGVGLRTMRHWIRQGLVPRPIGRGPGARYTDDHVTRLRATQVLREKGTRLVAIRSQFNKMTIEQIAALIPPPPRATTPDGIPVPPPPVNYPAWKYEVIELTKGLLLMVRTDTGELPRRIANEIYRHYGP